MKVIHIYRLEQDFTPDIISSCLLKRSHSRFIYFTRHLNAITGCNDLRRLAGASASESNQVIAAFVNVIYQRESKASGDEQRVGSQPVKTFGGRHWRGFMS